jgi:hypothetical protein
MDIIVVVRPASKEVSAERVMIPRSTGTTCVFGCGYGCGYGLRSLGLVTSYPLLGLAT